MASSSKTSNVVSPAVPSGFARRRKAILSGLVFLSVAYVIVFFSFRKSTLLQPADQFCQNQKRNGENDEPCSRSDLLGFQVSSGIMQLFMGTTGFLAWQWTRRAHTAIPNTPEGRLFGYLEDADRLNAGIFVFQTWDFFFSLMIPEHATIIFLTHHVLSALTAWFSLEYQLVHHYAIFFGGCSEISTIFLVFCDFDVYFPATTRGSVWGLFVMFCQVSFTLCFLYYRVIGWWMVSYRLWMDVLYVTIQTKTNLTEQYRPGKAWFLYIFLAMDVILGLLQLYWFGFGIVPKILEILQSREDD